MSRLSRSFLAQPSVDLAPQLLNKVLHRQGSVARIVEVEAYAGESDPASHGYKGLTPRTETMFGKPGLLYVYFTYGMHYCMNVVCGTDGEASAVLIRAAEPIAGLEDMWRRRPAARKASDLTSGPARLCQALGIDRSMDGTDLLAQSPGLTIGDDGTPPPEQPGIGSRVGISRAQEQPWRWWVAGNPNVSKAKGSVAITVFD